MLELLQVKVTGIAGSFYDFGSSLFKSGSFFSWLRRHLPKPPALFGAELFVAVSLAVCYFFLMFPQSAAPRSIDGNEMNPYLFTYLSSHPYSQKDVAAGFTSWKPRLAGPMISSWEYDQVFKYHNNSSTPKTPDSGYFIFGGYRININALIFSSYHAIWLFLLFLILILHRKDALFIMLGVFCGLMFNLMIPSGQWFYPWDMPTMLFFTWACLLYDKRQLFPLIVVVWLGSLFKETTLCCALLILLGEHWTLKKRIAGFATVVIASLLARKLLMAIYGVKTVVLALNDSGNIHELIFKTWSLLVGNIQQLFSLNLNHVLFTNAGALFLMMMIPWRSRRDVVFKILAMVFIIGQFLYGHITEFRIWYEILPLGWIVISEALSINFPMVLGSEAGGGTFQPSLVSNQTTRIMKGSYWLTMSVLLCLAIGVLVIGNLMEPAPEIASSIPQTATENASVSYDSFLRGLSKEQMENITALNLLSWTFATSPDATNRNGALAVELGERACKETDYKMTVVVGTLAAAYAEAGRFDDAISTGQKACALASELGETNLLSKNRELVTLYQAHKAYHESPPNSDASQPH
jgi:hypothetical protein